MSIYLLLYLIIILILLHIWYLVYKKYGQFLHGRYLTLSISFFAIWIGLYLTAFSTTLDPDILLLLSRSLYTLSLLGGYCMMFFAVFFSVKKTLNNKQKILNRLAIIGLTTVTILTLFSPYVIKTMKFNNEAGYYYEDFGPLFYIYIILYLLNPIIYIVIARKNIEKLRGIAKIRFKYISIWYSIFICNWILFLWILPILWVWVLQKEQILFFIPFILSIRYSIHRYNFLDPFMWIGRGFIWVNSILFASLFTDKIYNHYTSKIWSRFETFWWIENNFWLIHICIGITLFLISYKFLTKNLLVWTNYDSFIEKLEKMKAKIPFITNINDLNVFLKNSFQSSMSISNTHIKLFNNKKDKESEIYRFFKDNIKNTYFLNDIVFIEENKHKFNKKIIKQEISKDGYKPLRDVYSVGQIQQLKKFTHFLTWHIKYLDMYKNIHDLNINLDKKVDEKTMEYNNLISKQKEFISVVSHEMRSPITTAIFQTDCIIDDIEAWKLEKKYLEEELKSLYSQLTRSSDLVKKLFSVEKYDINKFSLFKEETDLYSFLKKEVYHFKKNNPKIDFDVNLDRKLGKIKIDRVQFRQVIDNLVNNAIKFANKDMPKVSFSAEKEDEHIHIKVEDNWKGFQDTDISSIFDKYFTGKSSSIWIWIGLYLCKKIVEFHDWRIEAKFSKKLKGGKFTIILPK